MFRKLAGLAVVASLFFAGSAFAGVITGSAHDFSGTTWTAEVCQVCHAPHNNVATTGLLWNHADPGSTYIPYSNPNTMSSAPGAPTGTSKLCLSCHDGQINVDAYGGGAGTVDIDTFNTAANMGLDLQNDHPISFDYPTPAVDPEMNDSAAPNLVTIGEDGQAVTGSIAALMLDGQSVECQSCHDVHNTTAVAGTKLLLIDNANSDLCLACHAK